MHIESSTRKGSAKYLAAILDFNKGAAKYLWRYKSRAKLIILKKKILISWLWDKELAIFLKKSWI